MRKSRWSAVPGSWAFSRNKSVRTFTQDSNSLGFLEDEIGLATHRRRVFFLAKEKKVNKVKDKAYEKLKAELKTRFISTVHIMWGRELKDLTENEIY